MYTKEKETFYQISKICSDFETVYGHSPSKVHIPEYLMDDLFLLGILYESNWFTWLFDDKKHLSLYFLGMEVIVKERNRKEITVE